MTNYKTYSIIKKKKSCLLMTYFVNANVEIKIIEFQIRNVSPSFKENERKKLFKL